MPDTNHILDAIDHALGDWAVSGDAMRWAPGRQPDDTGVWVTDYSAQAPVATGLWQTIGWTDESLSFREAEVDLRPYRASIQEDIRVLATLYRVPPYVMVDDVAPDGGPMDAHRRFIEGYDEDWSDGSGTRIVRYQRANGDWVVDTICRTSDGAEHIEGRRIETMRDVVDALTGAQMISSRTFNPQEPEDAAE